MKNWLFLAVVLACGILQATLLDFFRIFNLKPDLLLLCVVIACLTFSARWALFFGVFAGLFKDILSAGGFSNSLLFCLWSLAIIKLSRNITLEDRAARVILLFCVALAHNTACGLIMLYSAKSVPLGLFLRITFLGSLYTALLAPLALRIVKPDFFREEPLG